MNKGAVTILTLCVIILSSLLTIGTPATAQGGGTSAVFVPDRAPGQAQWTFMVYLDGDNNLEGAGIDDFLEMSSVGSTADVDIVVQFDRTPGYSTAYGNWTDTRRFHITPGLTPDAANGTSIGEANMGDPQTLIDFAQWAMSTYPAQNYALVIWNHGDGWRFAPQEYLFKGVAVDDTSGDVLYAPELRSAYATITNSGSNPLALLGYDACLMGMIEVDGQIAPYATVRVGSQATEPGDGWPYDTLLADLTANPAMTAAQLGTAIVDRYYASYGNNETQSAVNLGAAYTTLNTAVDAFAQALIANGGSYRTQLTDARMHSQSFDIASYVDLYDFAYEVNTRVSNTAIQSAAAGVMNAVSSAVIREHHGSGWPGAHGISIYFPSTLTGYDTLYDGSQNWLQFTANTHWDEWLHFYYSVDAPVLIAPGNGSYKKNNTPKFKWAAVTGATQYRIKVDNNANFSSPVIDVTRTTTAYTPTTALPDDLYYWHVQARVGGAWGEWSADWTFTVDTVKPARPTLDSPVGGVTVSDQYPLFQWTEPEVVDHYKIKVDDSSRFKSPEIKEKHVTGTTYTAAIQLANGTYYWRVRAVDAAGNKSKWSTVGKFKMAYSPMPPVLSPSTEEPPVIVPVLATVESDDPVVGQTGNWTAYDTPYASGGRYLYSSGSTDDTLTLSFKGTYLDVIYVKHPALGAFVVEVDGAVWQAVSCTAADTEFGARVSFSLPDGVHTARIYPQSGTIAIDAFGVEEVAAPVG